MNYLRIFRILFGVLAFIGFFILAGVVGASDYADYIGQDFNYSDYIWDIILGFALMFPCPIFENTIQNNSN